MARRKTGGQGTVIAVAEAVVAMASEVEGSAPVAAAPVAPAGEHPPVTGELPTAATLPVAAAVDEETRELRALLALALADIELCISRHHHVPDKALLAAIRQKVGGTP